MCVLWWILSENTMVASIKLATRGCSTVICVADERVHKQMSSYKIPFYCQNSAHKTLQNDCKKYQLIGVTSFYIIGDSNHIKAQTLKECFLNKKEKKKKDTVGRLFYWGPKENVSSPLKCWITSQRNHLPLTRPLWWGGERTSDWKGISPSFHCTSHSAVSCFGDRTQRGLWRRWADLDTGCNTSFI